MGTYKNDYRKEEDEALWEIHEIRRMLNKELKSKTIEQVNKEALEKFSTWKREAKESNHKVVT
jgi:hypothetical protein